MKKLLQLVIDVAGFLAFVFRRWSEDRCPQIAASLTFTTSLAIVPLFTVVVALLSHTPFFSDVMAQIKVFLLTNLVPDIANRIINVYMGQFAANAGRLTTFSLAALFVTALVTLYTVDESLNTIWRVRRSRKLLVSIGSYILVLLVGPLFIGIGMSVTSYLVTISMDASDFSPRTESAVLRAVPVTLGAVAFFLLYRIIPNRRVSASHAALGAFLAAVLFEAMKSLFSYYVRNVPTYALVYGALATVPILLLWMYFSWLVILLGAEFTACAAYWRHRTWRRVASPSARFREALEIGRRLAEARGEPVELRDLAGGVRMPHNDLEDTLHRLEDLHIVRRVGRTAYALAKAPNEITLGEFNDAVHLGEQLPAEVWSEYSEELAEAAEAMQEAFCKPLGSLARAEAAPAKPPQDGAK